MPRRRNPVPPAARPACRHRRRCRRWRKSTSSCSRCCAIGTQPPAANTSGARPPLARGVANGSDDMLVLPQGAGFFAGLGLGRLPRDRAGRFPCARSRAGWLGRQSPSRTRRWDGCSTGRGCRTGCAWRRSSWRRARPRPGRTAPPGASCRAARPSPRCPARGRHGRRAAPRSPPRSPPTLAARPRACRACRPLGNRRPRWRAAWHRATRPAGSAAGQRAAAGCVGRPRRQSPTRPA